MGAYPDFLEDDLKACSLYPDKSEDHFIYLSVMKSTSINVLLAIGAVSVSAQLPLYAQCKVSYFSANRCLFSNRILGGGLSWTKEWKCDAGSTCSPCKLRFYYVIIYLFSLGIYVEIISFHPYPHLSVYSSCYPCLLKRIQKLTRNNFD